VDSLWQRRNLLAVVPSVVWLRQNTRKWRDPTCWNAYMPTKHVETFSKFVRANEPWQWCVAKKITYARAEPRAELSQVIVQVMQLVGLVADIRHSEKGQRRCYNGMEHHRAWAACAFLCVVAYPVDSVYSYWRVSCKSHDKLTLSLCFGKHEVLPVNLLLRPHTPWKW